jgi:hypothetical protein
MVGITVNSGAGVTYTEITVDGVVVTTAGHESGGANYRGGLSCIVPNGSSYVVSAVGDTLLTWAELR